MTIVTSGTIPVSHFFFSLCKLSSVLQFSRTRKGLNLDTAGLSFTDICGKGRQWKRQVIPVFGGKGG